MMNITTSFTFLATLFVLLLISASIIFRSFLIRRRFRRQIEGALAQGVYFNTPPSGLGLVTHYIGEKPKVHEAWTKQSVLREKTHWQDVMPVSTVLTRSTELVGESRLSPNVPHRQPSFLARLTRRPESTGSHPTTNNVDLSPDDTASVCVLISMPRPHCPVHLRWPQDDPAATFVHKQQNLSVPTRKVTDEEDIPNVVFGITELPVQGPWTETNGVS